MPRLGDRMQQGQPVIKSRGRRADEVRELRAEAAEARQLAATFTSIAVVRDLLNYASALEQEARLETQNETVRNGHSYVDT